MKRVPFRTLRKTFLAVPAAALMLGVSQAQTTVGLNFQAWYYDSGASPQTVGFGTGYQTTGFPVTARAFGVAPANWYSTDPLPAQTPTAGLVTFGGTATTFAGSLTANVTAHNSWQSGIGEENGGFSAVPAVAETVVPGNDEVTWGYLDDGNSTGGFPSVLVSGLAAKFPHGYVIETIAANGGVKTYNNVDFTDGTTFTNSVAYTVYQVKSPFPNCDTPVGSVGVSAPSPVLTLDSITIAGEPKTSASRSTLAGFIITDQPVVGVDPASSTNNQGSPLVLSAGAFGIPPLSYQWRLNGVNISGATNSSLTNLSLTIGDAGNYDVMVTNLYGTTTSAEAVVAVNQVALITSDLLEATNVSYVGFNVMLSVGAAGALPLSYQWQKNGVPLAGATNASLTVSNLAVGLAGYSVTVTNIYGKAYSSTNYINAQAAPDTYTAKVGQDGPLTFWPLNETAGLTAIDYSGFGHNGVPTNTVTLGVVGPRPPTFPGFSSGTTAYQFDGASGYIIGGTDASISGTTDFSVEAWINTTATTAGVIANQRDNGGSGYLGEYGCTISAGGTLGFYLYGSGGYQFSISASKPVNDGNWHHVVFVRSGTAGIIYVDGANVASGSGAVEALNPSIQTFIGADQRNNSTFFSGSMADVAIYNTGLSAGQVALHYVAASGTALTVGLVHGGLIQDSKPTGTVHDGLNHGTTWLPTSVDASSYSRSGVQQFNETNSTQIVIPSDPDFNSTNGTISFWMQYTLVGSYPGSGAEGAMLFDCRTTNGTVIDLNIDGNIQFQASGGARFVSATTPGYVVDGNWHHVAVTYGQTTNDTVSLYIDGVLDTALANPGNWSWPANQEIELGRSHDPYWFLFDGQMDDFRIYNRILTAGEISTIGTKATSDTLIDTNALKLRFSFDTDSALFGNSITWPYGTLVSSPVMGPGAVWTPVPNAVSPQPIMTTAPSVYYRAMVAP